MSNNKLSIKVFHINNVNFSEKITVEKNVLNIKNEEFYKNILSKRNDLNKFIKSFRLQILSPSQRELYVNSIMDFIPISTKVLGVIGEGITHTMTGVVMMLTGADEKKNQICEFGKSDGILEEQVKFSRAGTPEEKDYIIHLDVEVFEKMHAYRECINAIHEFCDLITQDIREVLKKKKGSEATERHEFENVRNDSGKKVVILKQVAGQGAMYDTRVFAYEPSGFLGGYSVIDFMNMPILITPNEYRDGAIRAMH